MWLLAWFQGGEGWDAITGTVYPIDVPMLVTLENKPTAMRPAGDGIELAFAGPTGRVQIAPLYGVSHVRAAQTAKWAKALPSDVVKRCRLLASVSREIPIAVEEKFAVDPHRDLVTVRCRFEFETVEDAWGTERRRVAPLEFLTALAARGGWKPLQVQGELLDLDYALGQGAWMGVEGASEYVYALSGLTRYVNLVEQPKTIPQDDPLLAQARANYDVGGALWHRRHNSWWALENLGCAGAAGEKIPYLDEGAKAYARQSAKSLAAFTLNQNNLVFEFDAQRRVSFALDGQNYERMGWCDANATSNEGIRQAYAYALGTGDRQLIKDRWPFLCSYYNVPVRMAHWGDSALNTGGGDTFGSNLNGTIAFARLAYGVGDEQSYKFACYHAAKQFVALYAMTTEYPRWVMEKAMWSSVRSSEHSFEAREVDGKIALFVRDIRHVEVEDEKGKRHEAKDFGWRPVALEDIQFSDLRGGNYGIVPWCEVQRTSEAQERFLKDHCPAFQRYARDGMIRKWRPEFHRAALVDLTKADSREFLAREPVPHVMLEHCGVSLTDVDLRWRDRFLDVPPAERRARLQRQLEANERLHGREFEVILAGIPETYAPLWQDGSWTPRADTSFRQGLEKVAAGAWNSAMFATTPKFRWPTLGWGVVLPPRQPEVNSHGQVTLCGIVPDETKISFAAVGAAPSWTRSTWAADYLSYPVLTMAQTLDRLPLHLQSLVIERGLDQAEQHVNAFIAQSAIEWNVAGPFAYHQASDFDAKLPPEDGIDLAADFGEVKIGRDYRAKWTRRKTAMYHLDFNQLYEHNNTGFIDHAQVYTQVWVRSPAARDCQIALGSYDGVKVWVNDKLVWKNWVHRGTDWDQDRFPVRLEAGWNKVLLKVFNRMHGCGFEQRVRFCDDRLLPLADLEFSAEPPRDGTARRE